MEEVDLVPDEKCRLVAKSLGWTSIDNSIWTQAKYLVFLDISHNSLESLPCRIGELILLTELNCSCNKIKELPIDIGNLSKLKVLKANGNQISILPDEIGKCIELEQLILSENSFTNLPDAAAECLSLKVLHLQNNQLQALPKKLALLKNQLDEIDASNNPDLAMIPPDYRGNAPVILWILNFHYEKTKEMQLISQVTRQMNGFLSKSQLRMEETEQHLIKLEKEKEDLLTQKAAIKYYVAFTNYLKKWKSKFKSFREPHIYY
jgi:Leucine-rich repeat (LRR) protein